MTVCRIGHICRHTKQAVSSKPPKSSPDSQCQRSSACTRADGHRGHCNKKAIQRLAPTGRLPDPDLIAYDISDDEAGFAWMRVQYQRALIRQKSLMSLKSSASALPEARNPTALTAVPALTKIGECPKCYKPFGTKAGMALHIRHKH